MKKCPDCNIELIEDCKIKIHHTSPISYISVKCEYNDKNMDKDFSPYICPQCGLVRFYLDKPFKNWL